MNRRACGVLLFALLIARAFPAAALEVAEGVVTTAVSQRAPVDAIESYPSSVGRLFCFTRLTGAPGETRVVHVWFRGEEEVARVELPVRSADWRTWSAKEVLPQWRGPWRVEVLDADGRLLQSIPFSLN